MERQIQVNITRFNVLKQKLNSELKLISSSFKVFNKGIVLQFKEAMEEGKEVHDSLVDEIKIATSFYNKFTESDLDTRYEIVSGIIELISNSIIKIKDKTDEIFPYSDNITGNSVYRLFYYQNYNYIFSLYEIHMVSVAEILFGSKYKEDIVKDFGGKGNSMYDLIQFYSKSFLSSGVNPEKWEKGMSGIRKTRNRLIHENGMNRRGKYEIIRNNEIKTLLESLNTFTNISELFLIKKN